MNDMSELFTLYKLIVLYMLGKVDFPLTNGQISEFVLNKEYTTYFKLQQAISEMVDAGLIRTESVHTRTLYHLTEEGEKSIQYFKNKISLEIREDIDTFLTEKGCDFKDSVSVNANYYRNTNHEWEVRCRILEDNNSLLDLTITMPTKIEAETIANNWQHYHQEVYASLLKKLLQ